MFTVADLHGLIVAFIQNAAPEATTDGLGLDADTLAFIDSYAFLELVQHLEEQTGLQIDLSEADPAAFSRIGRLIDIITARQANEPTAPQGAASLS